MQQILNQIKKSIDDISNNVSSITKENITDAFGNLKKTLIENKLLTPESLAIEQEIKNHKVKSFKSTGDIQEVFSHIVMHGDLNPAETMYGGRMLELCDEAGCIFVYKNKGYRKVLTTEMQNIYFRCSPKLGDIVTFYGEVLEERHASVWVRIIAKNITAKDNPVVIDCQMRFANTEKLKK